MPRHEKPHEPSPNIIQNRLKAVRQAKGLSQGELAVRADITRQAVSAIEANRYLPTTAVALHLARVLGASVEDLFHFTEQSEVIEARLVDVPDNVSAGEQAIRVKIANVNRRYSARPVAGLGDVLNYTVGADGFLERVSANEGELLEGRSVRVRLLRDRHVIDQEIAVAGCDPAIFLAGEHLRRQKDQTSVVGWTMGSTAALRALQRGEVHVAGLHLLDPTTGESNLPFLRRVLKGSNYEVVTFATWEEGFLVRPGNPKSIHAAADLVDPLVTLVNREEGAGARLLLDQRLRAAGIDSTHIRGYETMASSHFEVARSIASHQSDVGIGIRSAAQFFGLDFVPLQAARYDLVVPKAYLKSHPTLSNLFDTLTSRPFRNEIEALGGYDTSETGKLHALRVS